MIHRRFAYCLEFDRRGGVWAGTEAQRQTVRKAFADHLVYLHPFDRTMWALARKVKLSSPYVQIIFETGIAFGRAYPSTILLNRDIYGDVLASTVMHELGHVVGYNLFNPIDTSEGWAESFKSWVFSNSPAAHPVWARIVPQIPT